MNPRSNTPRTRQKARSQTSIKELPSPRLPTAYCPSRTGDSRTVPDWLMISTSLVPWRDELRAKHDESFKRVVSCPYRGRNRVPVEADPRIFRAALPRPQSALEAAAGHAVPTRRELSARRVNLVDRPVAPPARPYFSSGPCAKPPGWSPDKLRTVALGRSHRG